MTSLFSKHRNKNQFLKVSFQQFAKDWSNTFGWDVTDPLIQEIYDETILPQRATTKSAGYDFFSPMHFTLAVGETIKIPTGIKVALNDNRWLMCVPRSGLGFKYRVQLDNTVGVIDADYFESDNEGHIFAKITNDGKEGKRVTIKAGEGMLQAIILPYDITVDDNVTTKRNGGLGSTSR